MARSRLEILEDEEAQSQAERARFEELADQYRQQSHLPPGGDQSWREREAMRRAAYDIGHIPPPSDQSEHEREAMQFSPAREDDTAIVEEERPESQEPVLQPIHVAKGGQGGIVLIFILVLAILLGIAVLAYPQMLTANYWRTPAAQPISGVQSPPPSVAQPSAAPAVPPPAEQSPALDLKRAPAEPAPPVTEAPPPVSVIDAAPKPAPTPKPSSRPRAFQGADRGAGGFYAKVPGPDGVMRDQYFSADQSAPSRPPARKEPAVPDKGGFYAKVPGPDGTLQDQFFPRQPPPR